MARLGIFVGDRGDWRFFREVHADLASRYDTTVFRESTFTMPLLRGRLNRWAFDRQVRALLRRSDVSFFEWASELLAHASHTPRQGRIVTRLHSYELYTWAPKVNWDHVDRVIVLSQAMRQAFADQCPTHAHKADVVHNGVSLKRFAPPPARPFRGILGMVCDILPVKRVYEMILTLHRLRSAGHDLELLVAGPALDGELRYAAAVRYLIEKLDLGAHVSLVGPVSDTASFLAGVDVFISNSFWEGQQVALLEAMAAGCQCLSHHWMGAEEVLPLEHLCRTDAELEAKILDYCAAPESERRARRERMRGIAVERFDIESTKAGIRRVIEEELHGGLRQAPPRA